MVILGMVCYRDHYIQRNMNRILTIFAKIQDVQQPLWNFAHQISWPKTTLIPAWKATLRSSGCHCIQVTNWLAGHARPSSHCDQPAGPLRLSSCSAADGWYSCAESCGQNKTTRSIWTCCLVGLLWKPSQRLAHETWNPSNPFDKGIIWWAMWVRVSGGLCRYVYEKNIFLERENRSPPISGQMQREQCEGDHDVSPPIM